MAYVVCAKWVAKPGEEAAVEAALRKLAPLSRAEEGSVAYIAHRDPDDPCVFFLYEQYRTKADYEAHGASAHFQEIAVGEAFASLALRERAFYETWEI
jgi:quinol monooxygenase YgiN